MYNEDFLLKPITDSPHRVPETLSEDVLTKMHAPPKPTDITVLNDPTDLEAFDGILFGIPTRYGNMPAQVKVNTPELRPCFLNGF